MWITPVAPYPSSRPVGWTCPECGTVMAPWMPQCTGVHSRPYRQPTTNVSNTGYNGTTISYTITSTDLQFPPNAWM